MKPLGFLNPRLKNPALANHTFCPMHNTAKQEGIVSSKVSSFDLKKNKNKKFGDCNNLLFSHALSIHTIKDFIECN